MTFKNFTKLSLSALLLAAATHSAIAEEATGGEVTLKDDKGIPVKTVSWATFVNALNNPASITGSVDPQVTKDLEEAKQTLKDKEDAKTAAVNAVTSAVSALETAQTALNSAKTALETAQAQLPDAEKKAKEAKKAYTDGQANSEENKQKIEELTETRSQKYGELASLEADKTKKTPTWLEEPYSNAKTFFDEYVAMSGESVIYYQITKIGGRQTSFDISFTIQTGWESLNQQQFYDKITETTFNTIRIYLGSNYPEDNGYLTITKDTDGVTILANAKTALNTLILSNKYGDEYANEAKRQEVRDEITTLTTQIANLNNAVDLKALLAASTEADAALTAIQTAITNANANVATETNNVAEAKNNLTTANNDVNTADTAVANAKAALATAQAAYDAAQEKANADALAPYKNVTLTDDVTADATISSFNGTIDGNGHIITLSGDNAPYLFNTLAGNVRNVAVNGRIFNGTQTGYSFNSVASWNNNLGTYYDLHGTPTSNINSIGALGFLARDKFGANVASKQLTFKTPETTVYSITVYKSATNPTPVYVNLIDGKFTNGSDLGITDNVFVKSATSDFGDICNVFYEEDGENKCKNVVITDKTNFYCPVDIAATNVTFDRVFTSGMNTVILPFDLTAGNHSSIDALCKYDVETKDKFWFKKIETGIPANTPFLLYGKEGAAEFTLNPLQNITIKQTPENGIVTDEGSANDPSKCFGTFKKASVEEFLGSFQSFKIYGLSSSGNFKAASSTALFPAFRMVISSELVRNNDTQRAPRLIGILDENGIDITDDIITGVENVAEETSSLNIAGGQGEIVITSDADYGKVEVYTMAGGVAAVADVMAGTTSVSLQKGIYIVMGKKVMVK